MIRRITWKLMSKHVDGLDEEMVEELHQLFLRMKMPGGYWHQGRDIVGEEIHGCGVPEYVERTFTLDGLVNMAVAKLTLDGGLALECVLNSLLEKDGTPEERKKVGSISAKIIERDNGNPHRRESAKYDFAGATIEKLYVESTVNEYNYGHEKEKPNGYSDEQIAQAIKAINGSKKPLNSKRKWAAVYWCLKWYCNFPANVSDFCDRVQGLPLGGLEYECDYNNIRRECALTFMDQDARYMDKVKPSKADNDFFQQCREVVLALVTELGKAALPQIDMG